MNGRIKDVDSVELYKEIYRLQNTIKEMSMVLKAKNAFQKKWALAPLVSVPENIEYKKVKKRKIKHKEAFHKVQVLMMN